MAATELADPFAPPPPPPGGKQGPTPAGAADGATAARRVRAAGGEDGEDALRGRLGLAGWPRPGRDRLWGWLFPGLVTLLAFLDRASKVSALRCTRKPDGGLDDCFDETYYARDAYSLLRHGVEMPPEASQTYVVHPPLGKWLIALGEQVFGFNETGWRAASVVVGSLTVLVFARLVRRVTRSTLLGGLGGVLLAVDGLEFVQSRIATLDIFLLFWMVCATACLAADRDHGRSRLAHRVQDPTRFWAGTWAGPRAGVRWWRVAAGVCLGAACATKWSGAFFLLGMVFLVFAWDAGARRTLGVRRPGCAAAWRDGLPLVAALAVLPVVVYVASWTGWFATNGGYNRHAKGNSIASLVDYHKQALCFHEGLTNSGGPKSRLLCGPNPGTSTPSSHPYESKPFGWFVLARPVAYAYETIKSGESRDGKTCTTRPHGDSPAQDCSREVLAVNTPVVWWAGLAAVLGCFFLWAARRDWRAALVLVGFAANFFPWLTNTERVAFQFYALPLLPFAVLALVLVCGVALGGPGGSERRRTVGAVGVGLFTLLALGDFAWLHPVLAGDVIPYSAWRARVTDLGFPGWL